MTEDDKSMEVTKRLRSGEEKELDAAAAEPLKRIARRDLRRMADSMARAFIKDAERRSGADEEDKEESECGEEDEALSLLRGAVKVCCIRSKPNVEMPWQVGAQTSGTGSGCLLEGRRVLTNAHVVEFATTITLLRHGSPRRFLARTLHLGREYDLALLEVVEDPDEFWTGTQPLALADELPALQSRITVVGCPINVDSLSITEGVVSRVLVEPYSISEISLLKLQVDAAINPGNSGGPGVVDGELVGVVFEAVDNVQNIGFLIPAPVVRHFLEQIKRHGTIRGICMLGIQSVPCENPSLRASLSLGKHEHGTVVRLVNPCSVSDGKLQPNDVLMKLDGHEVADDGSVQLRGSGERVMFSHIISLKHIGDPCKVCIKRGGKVMEVDLTLATGNFQLVPMIDRLRLETPRYLVWAGLVFLAITADYLNSYEHGVNDPHIPVVLRERCVCGKRTRPDDDLVVLSRVLADPLTRGYSGILDRVVVAINGEPVRNLEQVEKFLESVDAKTQPYVTIDLDDHDVIVLDTQKARDAHQTILRRNRIDHASHTSQ